MWAASIQSGSYVYLMRQLFGHDVFRRFSVHDFHDFLFTIFSFHIRRHLPYQLR